MRCLAQAVAVPALAVALAVSESPLAAQSRYGQSFTAPAAPNTLLQQLTVGSTGLYGTGATVANPYIAQIFALSGTTLTGSSLFSQALGPSFSGLSLTPNVVLAPGGTYAVLVALPSVPGATLAAFTPTDFYAGGAFQNCFETTCNADLFDDDVVGFGVQFGAANTTVPEPDAWGLLGIGLLGLAAVARRRRTGPPSGSA
jgi:hypothetical protein